MTTPLLPIIKTDGGGSPYVVSSRCTQCGHTYVGEREVCANCTARDAIEPGRLATSGKVYAWTVVHRSFPGVKTPFVDVIVDLDDGAHIKGSLVDIDPDEVDFDLPVEMVFRSEVPVGSDEPYLTYLFVPRSGAKS